MLFAVWAASSRAGAQAPEVESAPAVEGGRVDDRLVPDLGIVRYEDPSERRRLWLGLEVGGVFIPESVGVTTTDAWTLRGTGAWALALVPRVSAGGRHAIVQYSARNIRTQMSEHQVDLSARLLPDRVSLRDRLALSFEAHSLDKNWVDGERFDIGGVSDNVFGLGYGLLHGLSPAFELGWNVQLRYVDVFANTQRQVRASLRPALFLTARQRLALEVVLYLVHRDEMQRGDRFPRTGAHAQLALEHTWMTRDGVGTFADVRYATNFMSGQAPMYEVRQEAIETHYGEAHAGVRVVWD